MADDIDCTPDDQGVNTHDNDDHMEQRSEYFLAELINKLQGEKVETACIIIMDPQLNEPIIFTKGNHYAVGKLTARVTQIMKQQVIEELSA